MHLTGRWDGSNMKMFHMLMVGVRKILGQQFIHSLYSGIFPRSHCDLFMHGYMYMFSIAALRLDKMWDNSTRFALQTDRKRIRQFVVGVGGYFPFSI